MTPDVASLQYPNAYYVYVRTGYALSVELRCWKQEWDTFVIIVLAVETSLQFVRATILSLDLVVERSDVGRNLSSCNCGRGSEEYTQGGGREIHCFVSKCDKFVASKVSQTWSFRETFISGKRVRASVLKWHDQPCRLA